MQKEERSKQGQTKRQNNTVLLCLVVCLTLLASFFLLYLSLTCVHVHVGSVWCTTCVDVFGGFITPA